MALPRAPAAVPDARPRAVPLIDYANVTVCRGEHTALDRLHLTIHTGEHVAILGPNGSGKSTLIKTITRECYPRLGGSMRILGREVWNVFELRPLLGIVTNDLLDACARPFYSGIETVLSGFFSSVGIWPNHHVTSAMESRAAGVLDLLEASHLASRRMNEMSSGEVRRIVIARALVHDPKALVLDEPTNSLDLRATHELREMLRKIARAGTSIILVTHHLPDIIPEVERIVLLKQGRVHGDGPKPQMLAPRVLSGLFDTAVEVVSRDGYYQMW